MASRPLPPGRRGRGTRTTSSLHLPEVKILSEAPVPVSHANSYVEQPRSEPPPGPTAEPEQESTHESIVEPVKSVKALVASLEEVSEPAYAAPISTSHHAVVSPVEEPSSQVLNASTEEAPKLAFAASAPTPHHVVPAASEEVAPAADVAVSTPKSLHQPPMPTTTHTAVEVPRSPQSVNKTTVSATAGLESTQPLPQNSPPPALHTPTSAKAYSSPPQLVLHASDATTTAPMLEGFHPFKLLLPIDAVPGVPETVDCVFDDEAVEMQKNIIKAVKKVLGKDRSKLEDFKINARLFGNNFMDPHEYVESLFRDLGGNRALLLIPCLVSIQPDFMKRSSMLVAARNLRLRNLIKLQGALDVVDTAPSVVSPVPVSSNTSNAHIVTTASETKAHILVTPASPTATAVSVAPTEQVHSHRDEVTSHIVATEPSPVRDHSPAPTSRDTENNTLVQAAVEKDLSSPTSNVPSAPEPEAALHVDNSSISSFASESLSVTDTDGVNTDERVRLESVTNDSKKDDSQIANESITHTPVNSASSVASGIESQPSEHVAASAEKHTGSTTLTSGASFTTIDTSVSSERSSLSSTNAGDGQQTIVIVSPRNHVPPMRRKSTLSLFGDEIGDDDDDEDEDNDRFGKKSSESPPASSTLMPPATVNLSSSLDSSYNEAESLFGEVIPVAVKPAATPAPLVAKASRTGMLFGFASAGADSDSDSDSEFDD